MQHCGSLWRRHAVVVDGCDRRYLTAEYETDALDRIWRQCTAEYEGDRAWIVAQGLGPGVSLLEVGTYAGAFLAFAESLGCDAAGVDVNEGVVRYARGRGVDARLGPLRPEDWGPARFDQVWVLNCFEQVPDPDRLLGAIAAGLRPGGRLVLRTPDGDFVAAAHDGAEAALRPVAVANHVYGVPFLHCFTRRGLDALLARHGFDTVAVRGREFALRPSPTARRAGAVRARGRPHPWMDVACVRAPQTDRS